MGRLEHNAVHSERLAGKRRILAIAFGPLLASVGCTHDFSIFEPSTSQPATGSDGGSPPPVTDAGQPIDAGVDAHSGVHDAGVAPTQEASATTPEASTSDDGGSSCGNDCRIDAIACAGTCAQIEISCAGACDGGTECSACTTQETNCNTQCVSQCDTCTSGESCIDLSGCMDVVKNP